MKALRDLLAVAVAGTARASEMVRARRPREVLMKGDRDPATDMDLEVETALRTFLAEQTPHVGFFGEEGGRDHRIGDRIWVLDPIDGTVNYRHGIPLCAISLGLIEDGEPIVAVIALPFERTVYTAIRGCGAHRGGARITTSRTSNLTDAVVAVGDYAVGPTAPAQNHTRLAITASLAARAERIRMFGSAAIDLSWVAEGRIDASVMLSNKPWDTAAGVLIAREAGAVVIDVHGERHGFGSGSTVATTPHLAEALLDAVQQGIAQSRVEPNRPPVARRRPESLPGGRDGTALPNM